MESCRPAGNFRLKDKDMRKTESSIVEIQEDVVLHGLGITLERGDKISIVQETVDLMTTPLGSSIKMALTHFTFVNPPGPLVRRNYTTSSRYSSNQTYPYALCIPYTVDKRKDAFAVTEYLYNQLKSSGYSVSDLKDTRPKWDSLRFTVPFGTTGSIAEFYVSGIGTSFTPILIDIK